MPRPPLQPDHSTNFPQLTDFTNPNEQKPTSLNSVKSAQEPKMKCISTWQPWHKHIHYQSSIAIVKVNTIKLCK